MADNRIKSIFGAYAENLQLMVDSKQDAFAPLWFPKYFGFGIPQTSLTFVSAIGRSRVEAAAAIVDRNSPAPLGSHNRLEKLSGEVPAIKKKFKLQEDDYRNFLSIQNMNVSDAVKRQQLLNLMWDDVAKAGTAPLKTIDRMVLEGLSTGSITVTASNNPSGIVTETIDLLMPSGNKIFTTAVWGTAASAKPITDIKSTVETAAARGIVFEKVLMKLEQWWQLINATETQSFLAGYYRMPSSAKRIGTLEEVNQMLVASMLPYIEIVNVQIGTESDGTITAANPWASNRVAFIPAGNLGEIKNALAMEEIRPVGGISYAVNNRVLISKWAENDPFGEYTMGELNAFPAIDAIDSIYIMNTGATS